MSDDSAPDPLAPWYSVKATPETIRAHVAQMNAHAKPVVTRTEAFPPAPPREPEFLPISSNGYTRVRSVYEVDLLDDCIQLVWSKNDAFVEVAAPYFAAWLDRLGIPWTPELRKAHEDATKGEA